LNDNLLRKFQNNQTGVNIIDRNFPIYSYIEEVVLVRIIEG